MASFRIDLYNYRVHTLKDPNTLVPEPGSVLSLCVEHNSPVRERTLRTGDHRLALVTICGL